MKELFHGSVSRFDKIDLSKGKGYKDFGKGFYATAVKHHAETMAVRSKEVVIKRQNTLKLKNAGIKMEPVCAYRYNLIFDEAQAEKLKVKIFAEANSEWLRFIIANRKSPVSVHEYDIVIGPTADAETTMIINESIEELEESCYSDEVCNRVIAELQPENLPKQYFFGTDKALETLQFAEIRGVVIQ